jgi:hypothetical protein
MINQKKKKPTKADYLRIACGMSGVTMSNLTADVILETQKDMERLGGKFSLRDAAKIQTRIENKYKL